MWHGLQDFERRDPGAPHIAKQTESLLSFLSSSSPRLRTGGSPLTAPFFAGAPHHTSPTPVATVSSLAASSSSVAPEEVSSADASRMPLAETDDGLSGYRDGGRLNETELLNNSTRARVRLCRSFFSLFV